MGEGRLTYNKEFREITNIGDEKSKFTYGFMNLVGDFFGFKDGKIIREYDELLDEEKTLKLYIAMTEYYNRQDIKHEDFIFKNEKECCFINKKCDSTCMGYFEDVKTNEQRCKRFISVDGTQPMFIPNSPIKVYKGVAK